MKFAGADLLVHARNGSETGKECVSPMLGGNMGAILKLQTWWVANGDTRDRSGWEVWEDSRAQALESDVQAFQCLVFQQKEDTML